MTPPPAPKKSNWLALTFIILGLLLMGGSGWYLYQQHTPGAFNPPQQGGQAPPMMPGYPGQRPMGEDPAKAAERAQLLRAIEAEKARKAQQKTAAPQKAPAKKAAAKKAPKKRGDDKVFDELDKL